MSLWRDLMVIYRFRGLSHVLVALLFRSIVWAARLDSEGARSHAIDVAATYVNNREYPLGSDEYIGEAVVRACMFGVLFHGEDRHLAKRLVLEEISRKTDFLLATGEE